MSNDPSEAADQRLKAIEADIKSLKGKGLAIAVLTALLGSGGAAALTSNYWSARNLALQEKLTASDVTLKDVQAKHVELQSQQQKQTIAIQELELRSKKTKADQESFEARIEAHSLAMERLKKERRIAAEAQNPLRAVELDQSIRREERALREFLELHQRLVNENPDLPGWYRLGLEHALARLTVQ